MKNPVKYLKRFGARHALEVIWNYKIPKMQTRIMARITRHRPLEDKIIIESHNDFDCNGGALYDYLIEHGYNKRIKIVWRLYHTLDRKLPENVDAVPLYGPSWRKAWHICTAKWLTADCSIEDRVREEQISLNMTHGIYGLKNFKGLANLPSSVTYLLSPSQHMDSALIDAKNANVLTTKLIHPGYPILDRLVQRRHSDRYQKPEDSRKLILWMPTFRKGLMAGRCDSEGSYPYGVGLIEDETTMLRFASYLRKTGARVIIKLHPKEDISIIEEKSMKSISDVVTILSGNDIAHAPFDVYDLMIDSAALITDYSGAFFEYASLGKPAAFVMADVERYKVGLIPEAEKYMPGPKINVLSELEEFIHSVCVGEDSWSSERLAFANWFFEHNDGNACKRIVECLGIESAGEDK